jgi:hypothetical protein
MTIYLDNDFESEFAVTRKNTATGEDEPAAGLAAMVHWISKEKGGAPFHADLQVASTERSSTPGTYFAILSGDDLRAYLADNNLLTLAQSSMEDGLLYWANQNAATLSQNTSTTYVRNGIASLKVVTSNITQFEGAYTYGPIVPAGTTYTASVYARGAGTVQIGLLEWVSRSPAIYVGETYGTATALSPGSWTRLSVTRTFTTGRYPAIVVRTSTQQAVTFYLDAAMVQAGTTATEWHTEDYVGKTVWENFGDSSTVLIAEPHRVYASRRADR